MAIRQPTLCIAIWLIQAFDFIIKKLSPLGDTEGQLVAWKSYDTGERSHVVLDPA